MTKLTSRILETSDYPFFMDLVRTSLEWQEEECKVEDITEYLSSYKMYNGDWRVWLDENHLIGISYVLEWSPANEKPWIGTIIVHENFRGKGYGKAILNEIGMVLSDNGHKAIFAGCPIQRDSWLLFLGKCGFEQFKVEEDDTTHKKFMISVKPL
ncbi:MULTISPECIES: GNAT family N-acetyltransferase [Bacillaceae]|uniref:GNAT family N-acetyltransferase n=1 Tax=Bacillaceae TaxID=186817 RepID=UPI000BFC413E|nr:MULTISPECIES: GNAT family N-acetyltransferase [Bacillaceae]PGT78123.1 GNAT family N-acetyltransferase [Bacillus sp. AFS040349]UGB32521.1 GNAT family N-acetyltransferase [Metabacillus sp. B2-18]